jgi:hypothetical protein
LNSQEILEQIDAEISRLQQVKALLQGANGHQPSAVARHSQSAASAPARVKRVLSPEARKKIAAAQRKRWANARKAQAK